MFARLYFGLIFSLVATVYLFSFFGDGYMRRSEVEIFINDGRYFFNQYLKHRSEDSPLYQELETTKKEQFYIFNLEVIDRWDGTPPCECDLLFTMKSVPVYLTSGDLYTAVFPIPNSTESFVFSENVDFFQPEIPWFEDSELLFVLILSFCIIVVLCVSIYIPTRTLHKQIDQLILVQKRFGKGKLAERANADLPSPIRELASSFNEMAEEIESRVSQSQIFAQAIPHEVRTPLSRIQLANDLLRRKGTLPEGGLCDDIDTYVEDVNSLTTNIIMLSKLTTMESSFFELQKARVNFSQFINARIQAQPRGNIIVSQHIESDIVVRCDCTMARLVIDNILKNAIKYTHSSVSVRFSSQQDYWELDIEDNGPGIPDSKQKEIFMPFSRLDRSRNSKTGGFGLGLAIANAAAIRSNWQISISQSPLGGALFIIHIPK